MGKRREQGQAPANLDDFLGPPKDDVKKGVDTLLRSKPDAVAPESPGTPGDVRASPSPSPSPISIIGVHTIGPTGPQTVFRMQEDPLALRLQIRVDRSLSASETHFDANFQLIEYATNTVAQESWGRGIALQNGAEISISQGNIRGPGTADLTPPVSWGLKPGLYVFRPLIEIPALSVFYRPDRPVLFRVR